MAVVLQNISKKYGKHQVLNDISITLKKNSVIGLLGRNGAGKSTLLKLLAQINQPDNGRIEGDYSRLGFLSELNPLYPHYFVTEYLEWIASIQGVKNKKERINWAVEATGLQEVAHQKIKVLSKGFKQRLGLAAILLSDPDFVILDEPISGLDPIQIEEYRKLILSLSKDRVIILSSHLLQEIEAICDRILLIKDGSIIHDVNLKSDGTIYFLRTDRALDIHSLESFAELDEVEEIGLNTYEIKLSKGLQSSKQIFDGVIQQDCRILELRSDSTSIGKLFESL